jgi:hypothetical protein
MTMQNSFEVNPKNLVAVEDFDKTFYKLLSMPESRSQEFVFDLLNEKYMEHFGRYRYSSFDSYRVSRNKRLSKK